jgi:dethiobiotin synthetase
MASPEKSRNSSASSRKIPAKEGVSPVAGIFVTGTDTGVGKTVVSCALVRGFVEAGIDIGVMKPAETGVTSAGPEDAQALQSAAGVSDPLSLICPLQYALPAAPQASAEAEGRDIDLEEIDRAYRTLAARHQCMLVEGAGGLLVPFTPAFDMADLAAKLSLPVLLVARASLGTINHTLLSVEACRQRGLKLLGVVISHAGGPLSEADAKNLKVLRRRLGDDLIGEIPPLGDGAQAKPAQAGLARVRTHFDEVNR